MVVWTRLLFTIAYVNVVVDKEILYILLTCGFCPLKGSNTCKADKDCVQL